MFDFGVRLFGGALAAFAVFGCGLLGLSNGAQLNDQWHWAAAGLLSGLVFFSPIALYGGYYWGSRIASINGVARDPTTDADELRSI